MELTGAKRGDILRASDIQQLARVAQRSRPSIGSGVITGAGGTGPVRDDAGWFLVKITDVTGSGKDAKYSFTEQYVVSGNGAVDPSKGPGDVEDWTVPRKADKDVNPARSCIVEHTFAVNETALARRNIGAPSEFELWPSGTVPFLAILTAKTYGAGFITYSWYTVKDALTPSALTYSDVVDADGNPISGGPGSHPAYHERNLDLPVVGTTGTPAAPAFFDPLSVVWLRKGQGDYYLFDTEPWEDLFRRTGGSDADGEIAFLRYYDQTAGAWADGREVRLIEAE